MVSAFTNSVTKENKCSNFSSHDVFSFDLESLRETRWDDNTAYPDTDSSQPGVQALNAFPDGSKPCKKVLEIKFMFFKDPNHAAKIILIM